MLCAVASSSYDGDEIPSNVCLCTGFCSSPWFCVVVFVLRKGPYLAVCVARLLHNLARSSILRL